MSIVLKENDWAEKMIELRSLGKKPSETLQRVARYYIDKGYSHREIEQKLEAFALCCRTTYKAQTLGTYIERAIKQASKNPAVNIDYIPITDKEMDRIDSLTGIQTKRLAFTLLCLAKYHMAVNESCNYWVTDKDKDVMALANINTSIRRQCSMFRALEEEGLIECSKMVDRTSSRICYAEDGNVVLRITDFRNLGYQYMMYQGEPYFECANCGLVTKIKSPDKRLRKIKGVCQKTKQKYCPDCAVKIRTKQCCESVMRRRYKQLSSPDINKGVYTVYMHICPNQKRYIGITGTSLQDRWKRGVGYCDNMAFCSDIKKYGWDNIEHYQIAVIQNRELAMDIESFYIQRYNTTSKDYGYNRISGALTHGYDSSVEIQYQPVPVDGDGHILT